MTCTLVLTHWLANELEEAAQDSLETAGVLLASIYESPDGSRKILGRKICWVPAQAYQRREASALSISSDGYVPALQEAESMDACAIWFHTHPSHIGVPLPSPHDERVDRQLSDLFRLRTGSEVYGSLIVSPHAHGISFSGFLETSISRAAIVDLLHNIPKESDLDFLLHTPGGDMDAAEKLMKMIRTRVGKRRLRIFVPDFAKSAGTLMAIGGDVIAMSDSSELGPIDPQITLNDAHGNPIPHSIQWYLDAYDAHCKALNANPSDEVAKIMLGKLDPGTIKLFEAAHNRARKFAENQLMRYSSNFTKVAGDLLDTQRWPSHGQMIDREDAASIGLSVEYHEPQSPTWTLIWQLYTLQRMAVRDDGKLFESDIVSVPFESSSSAQSRVRTD